MRENRTIKLLFFLTFYLVCLYYADSQTFECSSDLYQVVNGKDLKILDPSSGTYSTIGTSSINYNGAGFNTEDGYIYGIGSGNILVRVNALGEATNLGSIANFSALSYSGDLDTLGNWYSFRKVSSGWIMNRIDVSEGQPTAIEYSVDVLGEHTPANCADISHNIKTGKFYGMSGGKLIAFDHQNRTVQVLEDYSTIAPSGSYGAVWSDIEGSTYFFNNFTGNIYKAIFKDDGSVQSFSFISTSSPNNSNDGMNCTLGAPPVFPEVCDNGIDDDGDGWIDCEDGECNQVAICSYSETTSSADGGLESNGNLSQKIAKRNFRRSQSNINLTLKKNQSIYNPDYRARSSRDFRLQDAVPSTPFKNSESRISSAEDLIGITNAVEVFSNDIYVGERRKASILATRSENGVYEHTKYICDRLNGAQVEKVVKTTIDGVPFLVTKFIRENGIVEYNANFSFFKMNDQAIQWESFWTLADYTDKDEFFNYQIWANNISNLESIISQMIFQIKRYFEISEIKVGDPPTVLINTIWYSNQKLFLKLSKPKNLTHIKLSGELKRTENGMNEPFSYEQTLLEDTLEVNMGGGYAIGVTVTDPLSSSSDAVYHADGSWGLDVDPAFNLVEQFKISSNIDATSQPAERMIERDVLVEAKVTSSLAIYRSLNASFKPESLDKFNYFKFSGQGGNEDIEVVFVKSSIGDWDKQPRKFLTISAKERDHFIDLTTFNQSLDDVKMIVFKYTNTHHKSHNLEIDIKNLKFTNERVLHASETSSITFAPNPVKDRAYLTVRSYNRGHYQLHFTDLNGRIVHSASGALSNGMNMIQVERPHRIKKGVYILKFISSDRQELNKKVVFSE